MARAVSFHILDVKLLHANDDFKSRMPQPQSETAKALQSGCLVNTADRLAVEIFPDRHQEEIQYAQDLDYAEAMNAISLPVLQID